MWGSSAPHPRDPLATATKQYREVMGIPKLWPPSDTSVTRDGDGDVQLPVPTRSPAELEQPWPTGQAPPSVPKSAPAGSALARRARNRISPKSRLNAAGQTAESGRP